MAPKICPTLEARGAGVLLGSCRLLAIAYKPWGMAPQQEESLSGLHQLHRGWGWLGNQACIQSLIAYSGRTLNGSLNHSMPPSPSLSDESNDLSFLGFSRTSQDPVQKGVKQRRLSKVTGVLRAYKLLAFPTRDKNQISGNVETHQCQD